MLAIFGRRASSGTSVVQTESLSCLLRSSQRSAPWRQSRTLCTSANTAEPPLETDKAGTDSSAREKRLREVRVSPSKPAPITGSAFTSHTFSDPFPGFSDDAIHSRALKEERQRQKIVSVEGAVSLGNGAGSLSILPNGVRVASLSDSNMSAGVGLFVKYGARNELPEESGLSWLMENMTFKSSPRYQMQQFLPAFEDIGAHCFGQSTKEELVVVSEAVTSELPKILEVLVDTTLNPLHREDELADQKEVMKHTLENYLLTPEMMLHDEINAVAFGKDSPLGRRSIVDKEELESFTVDRLAAFKKKALVAPNIVLAATGMQHSELMEITYKTPLCSLPADNSVIVQHHDTSSSYYVLPEDAKCKYVGGYKAIKDTRREFLKSLGYPIPPNYRDIGSCIVAFEAPNLFSGRQFIAMCILQSLMGSGGSFSSGGPGKGMYSRSYQDILSNRYVEFVNCHYMPYTETGLFGLHVTGDPHHLANLVVLSCIQLLKLTSIGDTEYIRARNQVKSQMFSRLETRTVKLDDLGRQVLLFNHFETGEKQAELIDSITKEEVEQLTLEMLRSTPSVLLYYNSKSDADAAPSYENIKEYFKSYTN